MLFRSCLSRGAKSVTFVDQSREAIKLIRENLAHCQMEGEVVQADSIGFIGRNGKYDVILIDPPYDSDLMDKALEKIAAFDILNDGGIIVCEGRLDKTVQDLPAPYYVVKERKYGKIKVTICGKREAEA